MAHWADKHTKKDIVTHYESEIAKNLEEIERLQAEVERLHELTIKLSIDRNVPTMRIAYKMHKQQVQATDDYMALYAQFKTARNDALEEAARVAKHYADADYCGMGYPEAGGIAASGTAYTIEEGIRALKTGDK